MGCSEEEPQQLPERLEKTAAGYDMEISFELHFWGHEQKKNKKAANMKPHDEIPLSGNVFEIGFAIIEKLRPEHDSMSTHKRYKRADRK